MHMQMDVWFLELWMKVAGQSASVWLHPSAWPTGRHACMIRHWDITDDRCTAVPWPKITAVDSSCAQLVLLESLIFVVHLLHVDLMAAQPVLAM